MYERNAVILDKYFSKMFGYEDKSNLKNNYKNYCDLVLKLEEYQNISEKEDNTMKEFERIANEIQQIQAEQETLYKKNIKLQETRHRLYNNLEESADILKKKFAKIEDEIEKNNSEIKANSLIFVEKMGEFHQKSEERTICGKERRIIEDDYQKMLKYITENFENIDQNKFMVIKQFLKHEDIEEIKQEIIELITKNGEREKIPFDMNIIKKAIEIDLEVEEERVKVLASIHEKTSRLINEIKNDNIKMERHKKVVRDSGSKLKFLGVISEYIGLFLDNERMNVIGGETEHQKLMEEAFAYIEKDIEQIKNLYELLVKEITGRASKKAYREKYNPEYFQELLKDEKSFEKSISNINVVGTIIYPSYWRVEGLKKIYDLFREIITNTYEKDLSEYEPLEPIKEDSSEQTLENGNKASYQDEDEFDWGDLGIYDDESDETEENTDEDYDEENEEEENDNQDEYFEDDDIQEEDFKFYEEEDTSNAENTDEDNDYEDEDEEDAEDDYDDEEEDIENEKEMYKEDEDEEDDDDRIIDEILGFYNSSNHEQNLKEEDLDFDWEEKTEQKTS